MIGIFKVIWVDGFAREAVSDRLIAENLSFAQAKELRDRLNLECAGDESSWHLIVPQSHPLWRGMAEFV